MSLDGGTLEREIAEGRERTVEKLGENNK